MAKYTDPHVVIRSLHDVGLAGWFGGSLMGAVGIPGAAEVNSSDLKKAKATAAGWGRWSPVAAGSIAAHLIGGAGILAANKGRIANERGVRRNTVAKTVLTSLALASSGYAALLGGRLEQLAKKSSDDKDFTERAGAIEKQLRILSWTTPALTGGMLVLTSVQGEYQRPGLQVQGALHSVMDRLPVDAIKDAVDKVSIDAVREKLAFAS